MPRSRSRDSPSIGRLSDTSFVWFTMHINFRGPASFEGGLHPRFLAGLGVCVSVMTAGRLCRVRPGQEARGTDYDETFKSSEHQDHDHFREKTWKLRRRPRLALKLGIDFSNPLYRSLPVKGTGPQIHVSFLCSFITVSKLSLGLEKEGRCQPCSKRTKKNKLIKSRYEVLLHRIRIVPYKPLRSI
ncbi:hypothetical protein F4802DRAFT_117026 [Xylaria palmicola]|nr:hypothetical protein F4802DRAFT_117026 [Xylaria palmicola]